MSKDPKDKTCATTRRTKHEQRPEGQNMRKDPTDPTQGYRCRYHLGPRYMESRLHGGTRGPQTGRPQGASDLTPRQGAPGSTRSGGPGGPQVGPESTSMWRKTRVVVVLRAEYDEPSLKTLSLVSRLLARLYCSTAILYTLSRACARRRRFAVGTHAKMMKSLTRGHQIRGSHLKPKMTERLFK